MEIANLELKCIYCRAVLVFMIQNQPYLRDQGFKHSLRYCDGCKTRPALSANSIIDHPRAG